MIDKTAWQTLPSRTAGQATEALVRINQVLNDDPFVRMLSPDIRGCMAEGLLLSLRAHSTYGEGALSLDTHKQMTRDLNRAIRHMPLGFVTDDFKTHVADLVIYALVPFYDYNTFHAA